MGSADDNHPTYVWGFVDLPSLARTCPDLPGLAQLCLLVELLVDKPFDAFAGFEALLLANVPEYSVFLNSSDVAIKLSEILPRCLAEGSLAPLVLANALLRKWVGTPRAAMQVWCKRGTAAISASPPCAPTTAS